MAEDDKEKEFMHGWHWTLNHMVSGLGSAAAMVGLKIQEELDSIAKKIEARFKK